MNKSYDFVQKTCVNVKNPVDIYKQSVEYGWKH